MKNKLGDIAMMRRMFAHKGLGNSVRAFSRDESGATSIEYGLIVALLFLAIVASVKAFSTTTSGNYTAIADSISNAGN
ncbi:MAG: Flp family type IVb pilin [Pseudomonadota bacterium]